MGAFQTASGQKAAGTHATSRADAPWKPGNPVVEAIAATKPAPAKQLIAGGPVVEIAAQPDTESRDFKVLTERRDRLFALAESQLENGAHDEAYDILKQAAEIANIAIRKSGSELPQLLRTAEILRRLGQVAARVGTPDESRGFYERGRHLILDARKKSAIDTDGATILAEIDAALQKLPTR